MAATWVARVEVLDLATKQVRVTSIRTDEADPGNPFVHVTEGNVTVGNWTLAQIRDMLVAQAVAAYRAYATRQAQINVIATQYEAALAAALNAEEPL